jgi:hypothetical protein
MEGVILMKCQACRFWVPSNASRDVAPRGECTANLEQQMVATISIQENTEGRFIIVKSKVMLTAFDFGCIRYEAVSEEPADAAQQAYPP